MCRISRSRLPGGQKMNPRIDVNFALLGADSTKIYFNRLRLRNDAISIMLYIVYTDTASQRLPIWIWQKPVFDIIERENLCFLKRRLYLIFSPHYCPVNFFKKRLIYRIQNSNEPASSFLDIVIYIYTYNKDIDLLPKRKIIFNFIITYLDSATRVSYILLNFQIRYFIITVLRWPYYIYIYICLTFGTEKLK